LLDLDGCALIRSDGSEVVLTRSEFALLREFVSHCGRVLSRDYLLDALAGKRADPFDRSVDMLVARLRRKMEPEPKQPTLIVTVPGEGYKFAASVAEAAPTPLTDLEARPAPLTLEPHHTGPPPNEAAIAPRTRKSWWQPVLGRRPVLIGLFALACLVVGAGWWTWPRKGPPEDPPRLALLPFTNLSADSAQDYLSTGVTAELVTLLATFPGIRVVPTAVLTGPKDLSLVDAGRLTEAKYALRGGLLKRADTIRITAQLYDTATGQALWADRYDASGADPLLLQVDLADRIYQTVAGLRGSLTGAAELDAWRKTGPSLGEYDYYLRGLVYFFNFNPADNLRAREIWREGLTRFPDSPILRTKLPWTYLWPVWNNVSDDPQGDVERAWHLAMDAERVTDKSALATWCQHWLMAYLYQWHDRDFARSVLEVHAAVQMVPYDSFSRVDLSWLLANAGKLEEATEWVQWGVRHYRNAPFYGFLYDVAWVNYLSGRYDDVVQLVSKHGYYAPKIIAASLVRLGRIAEAKSVMADWVKSHPRDTMAAEAYFPLVEPYRKAWLDDLRAAGLPE
jgi:TolB-like protein/DNA-binding winged helix-turn-helix (wHTH) protein